MPKEKEAKIEYRRNRDRKWKKIQAKRMSKKWNINFLFSIKMSIKTLKFDEGEVNKKKFHVSKQPTPLNLANVNQILITIKSE